MTATRLLSAEVMRHPINELAVSAKLKSATPSWSEFIVPIGIEIVVTQPMEILAEPGLDFVGWLPNRECRDPEEGHESCGIEALTHASGTG